MIGADINGWATRAGSLRELERSRLPQDADELQRSIDAFPTNARPYCELIADRSAGTRRPSEASL